MYLCQVLSAGYNGTGMCVWTSKLVEKCGEKGGEGKNSRTIYEAVANNEVVQAQHVGFAKP